MRIIILSFCLLLFSCGNQNRINIYSVQDDISLGKQMSEEIRQNPQMKIWKRNEHPKAYAVIDTVINEIFKSNSLTYKEEFDWNIFIIEDPNTQNAFALPGGFIFVYTGLIHGMNSMDELAAVLAHEVAHIDARHATHALTRDYGVSVLLNLLLGQDNAQVSSVLTSMLSLKYSRDNELEADKKAVDYLCNSQFNPFAIADYFANDKQDSLAFSIPEFISTHPNSQERIAQINTLKNQTQCNSNSHPSIAFDRIKSYFH